jgi:hypothetical protein
MSSEWSAMTLLTQGKGSGSSAVVIVDTNDIGSSRGYVVSSSSCRAVEVGGTAPNCCVQFTDRVRTTPYAVFVPPLAKLVALVIRT